MRTSAVWLSCVIICSGTMLPPCQFNATVSNTVPRAINILITLATRFIFVGKGTKKMIIHN